MAPLEYTLTTTWPTGLSTKPSYYRYTGSGLTKAPVAWAMASVADRELHAVLGDQVLAGGFVVHREGGDLGAYAGEAVRRPLEGPQLGVADGAP